MTIIEANELISLIMKYQDATTIPVNLACFLYSYLTGTPALAGRLDWIMRPWTKIAPRLPVSNQLKYEIVYVLKHDHLEHRHLRMAGLFRRILWELHNVAIQAKVRPTRAGFLYIVCDDLDTLNTPKGTPIHKPALSL